MAKHQDVSSPPRRLRYGSSSTDIGPVVHTYSAEEPHSGDRIQYQNDDLIAQLLEAISNTEEFSYIRKLMAERMPPGYGGGEMGADSTDSNPATAMARQTQSQYARVRSGGMALHYRKRDDESVWTEHYQKLDSAHQQACSAFDEFNESRKGISDRIANHALRHGLSYDEAAFDIGSPRPNVKLPTASTV